MREVLTWWGLGYVWSFLTLNSEFLKLISFVYLCTFGHAASCCCVGFSVVVVSRGHVPVVVCRFRIELAALVAGHGAFGSCGPWAQYLWLPGPRAQAQQLWCMGLAALWHGGSSRIRDRTRVSCIGRRITPESGKPWTWILNHSVINILCTCVVKITSVLGINPVQLEGQNDGNRLGL